MPSLGRAVAAADLNGDGRLDLAATAAGPPGGRGSVAIFLGTGGGAFGAAVPYEVGRFPYSIISHSFPKQTPKCFGFCIQWRN